jgi:hypothetical protein
MRLSNKREILRWSNDIRSGDGRRWAARIQVDPVNRNPYAAPLDPTSEHLDPSTDIVVLGTGIFDLTNDSANPELYDSVLKRTGLLNVHPRFETTFRQAYSVQIGGENGEFEVVGVNTGVNKITCHVKLQSRQ